MIDTRRMLSLISDNAVAAPDFGILMLKKMPTWMCDARLTEPRRFSAEGAMPGCSSWAVLTQPIVLAVPPHPLYAEETFDISVFANTNSDNTNTEACGTVCELVGVHVVVGFRADMFEYTGEYELSSHFDTASTVPLETTDFLVGNEGYTAAIDVLWTQTDGNPRE
jgi:hypothetical protein